MVNLLSLATDPDKEREGVESVYHSADGPMRIWTRPIRCAAYDEEMSRIGVEMSLRKGDLAIEDWTEIRYLAAVRVLFVRWADVTDSDGHPVEYTAELGERIFRLPSMQRMYRFWLESSANLSGYGLSPDSEAAKNLSACSNGRCDGATSSRILSAPTVETEIPVSLQAAPN